MEEDFARTLATVLPPRVRVLMALLRRHLRLEQSRTLPSGSPRNIAPTAKNSIKDIPVWEPYNLLQAFKALPVDQTRTGPGADGRFCEPAAT